MKQVYMLCLNRSGHLTVWVRFPPTLLTPLTIGRAGSIPALSTFINLKTIIMRAKKSIRAWVAREKNGALFLFCEKPKKSKSYWINSNTFNSLVLPKEAFPNVKSE